MKEILELLIEMLQVVHGDRHTLDEVERKATMLLESIRHKGD